MDTKLRGCKEQIIVMLYKSNYKTKCMHCVSGPLVIRRLDAEFIEECFAGIFHLSLDLLVCHLQHLSDVCVLVLLLKEDVLGFHCGLIDTPEHLHG